MRALNPHQTMSHWTGIKTELRDLTALDAAVTELGGVLVCGPAARARGYLNRTRDCAHAICLPQSPYDIAVDLQPDGTFALSTDWYQGHVEKVVGKDFGRLIQAYNIHKMDLEAMARGQQTARYRHAATNRQVLLVGERGQRPVLDRSIVPTPSDWVAM